MRNIPDELVKRYEREGWWTPDTLGDLLARGLAAAPGTRVPGALGRAAVHGHLRRRGTDRAAAGGRAARARRRPGRRGGPAVAELDRGGGDVLGLGAAGRGRRADRALLRPQGADPHPRRRQAQGRSSPRQSFGRMVFEPDISAGVPIVGVVGGSGASGGAARRPSTTCWPTNRWTACWPPIRPGRH